MSATGHDDLEVPLLGRGRLHDLDRAAAARGSGRPPRPAGRWPTARSAGPGCSSSASSRSRERARWAPRLVPATACTSSTITVSTPRSDSRACEVSMQEQRLGRGDQDVGRGAGEGPPLVGRGVAGAHADGDVGRGQARAASAACRMPASGRAQVALDVDGQRLERARRRAPGSAAPLLGGRARAASRSSAHRNAASVLPEPVGATTSACWPRLIASQAPAWAAVGAPKAPRNHSAVAGEKRSSTSAPGPLPGSLCWGEAIGASVPPATDSRATE